MAPHRIFTIPELLEQILLQTDPQTLLTSAQQVSQTWHTLIITSTPLQQSLFFKPTTARPKNNPRTPNPFLPKIWSRLFRKRLTSHPTPSTNYHYTLPPADPLDEALFLHPTATWRRMLVQQPPTSSIGVFVLDPSWIACDGDDISPVRIFQAEVEFLTLEHLHWSAMVGCLLPLARELVFWDHKDYYKRREVVWKREMDLALHRYGGDCDLTVFTGGNWDLWRVLGGITYC
ncbi:hypothetical protein BDV23DRAFT_176745 [Aspergillus alliaceus]|uniref:F-box domain-containing protein n=1 Tax=Petromyces alliaceus TaxID=209559 RepID=A0A5N7BT36_PETAA|nr:hypothetical protein BDV23DRAFT_176745 [Aspergillus alliaceus]